MARKRTLNYREFRGDYDEAGGEERPKGEEEEAEDEEEDDEEEEEGEASDEEGAEVAADEEEGEGEEGEEDEDGVPKKKKKKKVPKKVVVKPVKPKRTRAVKVIRLRVVWGVFNNSNQRVATYDYAKRAEADEHAAKLATDKKQTFFVQPVKEPIEEKVEKA